jgi:hypothetical protein
MTSVSQILMTFDHDRKQAREAYQAAFGMAVDDPAHFEELERLLREQRSADKIELPPRLALALVMRPRSKSQGTPPKPKWARRQAKMLVRKASHRWDALIEGGMPKLEAQDQAAEEAIAEARASGEFEYSGITTAQTLEAKMRRRMP